MTTLTLWWKLMLEPPSGKSNWTIFGKAGDVSPVVQPLHIWVITQGHRCMLTHHGQGARQCLVRNNGEDISVLVCGRMHQQMVVYSRTRILF